MGKEVKLPNFLVIGAQRCATTWLYQNLKSHPEIFLPFIKELRYFTVYYDKGLDWYARYFKTAKQEKAIGEISPSYLYYQNAIAAERIHQVLPDCKLIVCFRNPIQRAYSQYKKHVFGNCAANSFEEAIQSNAEYLDRGKYYAQFMEFTKRWDKNKILVLIYEDLLKSPQDYLRKIYDFLEVDSDFESPYADMAAPPENVGKGLYEHVLALSVFLRQKCAAGKVIDFLKNSPAVHLFDRAFHRFPGKVKTGAQADPRNAPPLLPETRKRLQEQFAEGNKKLQDYLGKDLSIWK